MWSSRRTNHRRNYHCHHRICCQLESINYLDESLDSVSIRYLSTYLDRSIDLFAWAPRKSSFGADWYEYSDARRAPEERSMSQRILGSIHIVTFRTCARVDRESSLLMIHLWLASAHSQQHCMDWCALFSFLPLYDHQRKCVERAVLETSISQELWWQHENRYLLLAKTCLSSSSKYKRRSPVLGMLGCKLGTDRSDPADCTCCMCSKSMGELRRRIFFTRKIHLAVDSLHLCIGCRRMPWWEAWNLDHWFCHDRKEIPSGWGYRPGKDRHVYVAERPCRSRNVSVFDRCLSNDPGVWSEPPEIHS